MYVVNTFDTVTAIWRARYQSHIKKRTTYLVSLPNKKELLFNFLIFYSLGG